MSLPRPTEGRSLARTLVLVTTAVLAGCAVLVAVSFALTAERQPERGASSYCEFLEAEIYFFEGPRAELTEEQRETLHAWRTDCE